MAKANDGDRITIRLSATELSELKKRRAACGHASDAATIRSWLHDPAPTLFPLFREGKNLVEIVEVTGLSVDIVRACHKDFASNSFAAPTPVPVVLAVEKEKTQRLRLLAAIEDENRATRERMHAASLEEKRKRAEMNAASRRDHDDSVRRGERLRALSEPYIPVPRLGFRG